MPPLPAEKTARFPFLQGILPLERDRVGTDLLAGVALAALAIPEVLGYARIAGMPVVTGLYTLLIPLVLFALVGSSRHLVIGADSATAAITSASLIALATPGSPRYLALAALLALLTGLALLLARVARLGFLADFLSRTVLVGFLAGVGVQVALMQLAGMLGLPDAGHSLLAQLAVVATQLGRLNPWTLGVSAAVLAIILLVERVNRRVPGALIAVAGALVASAALHLPAHGVEVLGAVPSGLPRLAIPAANPSDLVALLATAGSLFLVVLAQSSATSRAYAAMHGDHVDEDVDLVGLGLANISAGLTGAFVVNGSPTKTEMVESAGGTSQIAQLAAAATVLVVLLFFTHLLAALPIAVLSAVVFLIGVKLVDVRRFAAIYRVARAEFGVALVTSVTVVLAGVAPGLAFAIVLSILIHIYHGYRPFDFLLVREEDGHWHSRDTSSGEQATPGVLVYRFGASLYYANANRFESEVRRLVTTAQPPLRALIISAEAIGDIDYSAAEMLKGLVVWLRRHGVEPIMTDVAHNVREELRVNGLGDVLGWNHVHHGLTDAMIDAESAEPGEPGAR
jgi:SulP family sulfate permease